MNRQLNNQLTWVTRVTLILSFIVSAWFWFNGGNEKRVFYGDALGYYTYLPAFFIHDALDNVDSLATIEKIPEKTRFGISLFQEHYQQNDEGKSIIQYTYGVALFSSPFFFMARIGDCIIGDCGTGYENIYQILIKFSSIFYSMFGFYFLYLSLKRFYTKNTVFQSLSILYLGSNVLWFTVIQAGMSHNISFFLISLLIYLSLIYYENMRTWKLMMIGLTLGAITLVRPTDLLFIFIPLFIGITDKSSFYNRIDHFKKNWIKMLGIGSIGFIIPILPQFMYWYHISGDWLYNSYGERGFVWSSPRIIEGLFGAKNGWWMYSPLLIIPTLFTFAKKYSKAILVPSLIIIPIYIYVAYSWWCYNYINGFGSRPMIHLYPLLAFSFTGILSSKSRFIQYLTAIFAIASITINLNFTDKAHRDLLDPPSSNWEFNKSTFFKHKINYSDLVVLDTKIKQPVNFDPSQYSLIKERVPDLVTDSLYLVTDKLPYLAFDSSDDYYPFKILYTLEDKDLQKSSSLYVGGEFRMPVSIYSKYEHHLLVCSIEKKGKPNLWYGLRINNKIGKMNSNTEIDIFTTLDNTWGEVGMVIPTNLLAAGDKLKLLLWNIGKKPLEVKSLSISKR